MQGGMNTPEKVGAGAKRLLACRRLSERRAIPTGQVEDAIPAGESNGTAPWLAKQEM
jgi:hypothetical protein